MDELKRTPELGDTFAFENLRVTVTEVESLRAVECEVIVVEKQEE